MVRVQNSVGDLGLISSINVSESPRWALRCAHPVKYSLLFSSPQRLFFGGCCFSSTWPWLHSPQSIQTFIILTVHKQYFFKEHQYWRDRVKFTMQMKRNAIEIVCCGCCCERKAEIDIQMCLIWIVWGLCAFDGRQSFIPYDLTAAQMFIALCVLLALLGRNTFIIVWVTGIFL